MHNSWHVLLVSWLLVASSCTDNSVAPPKQSEDMDQDPGQLDMRNASSRQDMSLKDMALEDGGVVSCTPQGDGDLGILQNLVCGPCGLGLFECKKGSDAFQGLCNLSGSEELGTIDKMQECEQKLVYVDGAIEATASGIGTKQAPFASLAWALEQSSPGQMVVVSDATQTLKVPLYVRPGVHVFGGFKRVQETWHYNPAGRTRLQVESNEPEFGRVGVVAKGITARTVWSRLEVKTGDLTQPTQTQAVNLGILVIGSNAFRLKHMLIQSGQGSPGAQGKRGASGTDGLQGQDALLPSKYHLRDDFSTPPHPGSAGGTSPCGVQGGQGGAGGQGQTGEIPPTPGVRGGSSPRAAGGKGGERSYSLRDGGAGEPGQSPEAQMRGARGAPQERGRFAPSSNTFGVTWRTLNATGLRGEDGVAGGGGGGGGGALRVACTNPSSSWATGATGAGGGSGGCGGAGGEGGAGGGASVGIALIDATLEIENVKVQASLGGQGGMGGQGGEGGRGGEGGQGAENPETIPVGGACFVGCQNGFCRGSGSGAKGGKGQEGERGGGGAGGASLGIVCSGTSLLEAKEVEILSDGSAPGGEGQGNSGKGASGLSAKTQGCD